MNRALRGVVLFLGLISAGAVQGQVDVFSRDNSGTSNWWDGANPWSRPCDGFLLDRPDKNNCTNFDDLGRTNVFIGHDNFNPMVVNGTFFQLLSLTIQNGVTIPRTYNSAEGGGISLTDGLFNLSTSSQSFNVPIGVDDATVTFDADAGNLNFFEEFFLNDNTAVFDGGNNTFISGHIQGAGGSVVKNGSGLLIFANSSNNYTGSTTINSGTLRIGNDSDDGVLPTAVTNNATLQFRRSNNYTYGNVISGTGQVVKGSGGTLTLSNDNTYSGLTTVEAGVLRITNPGALGSTDAGTVVEDGAALELNATDNYPAENLTLNGTGIGDGGALRKTSTETQQFPGDITLDENARITVTGGTFDHRGELNLDGHTVYIGGNLNYEMGAGSSIAGATKTSDDGAIFKDGFGFFILRPNPGLTGTIRLVQGELRTFNTIPAGGELRISEEGIISSTSTADREIAKNTLVLGDIFIGGTAAIRNGAVEFTGDFDLTGDTRELEMTYTNRILGTVQNGGITKTGPGSLTLSGANTYEGDTRIGQGNLTLNNAQAAQNSTIDMNVADGGTIQFGSVPSEYILGGLTGSRSFSMGTKTLRVGNNNTSTTYAGGLSNGNFEKIGSGTLTFSGIHTYAGSTTVTSGTLLLGGPDRISDNSDLVMNGGTFSTGNGAGNNETLGLLELNSNSTIALGAGSHQLNFAASSSASWTPSQTLTITGWIGNEEEPGIEGRIFIGSDDSGLDAGQLAQISFEGYGQGAVILSNGEIVPRLETSTLLDNFDRANNSVVGNPSGGQPGTWLEAEAFAGTPDPIACDPFPTGEFIRISGNELVLSNTANGCSISGYKNAAFDISGMYSDKFAHADGTLEWYFNMRQPRSNPSGFTANGYGVAFVLGADSPEFSRFKADGSVGDSKGYAVILGETGSQDSIRIIHFSGGINGISFDTRTVLAVNSPGAFNSHYSFKVTFDPCISEFSMTVRNDGSSFGDPFSVAGTPTTGIDETYVDESLPYIGGLWNHGSAGNQAAKFDNIYIPTKPAVANVYTWTGSINTDYQNPGNWSPARECLKRNDVLEFSNGGSVEVTNVPDDTFGQLKVFNNTELTLKDLVGVSPTTVSHLLLKGGTGDDFVVEEGSVLNLDVGNTVAGNGFVVELDRDATALISGEINLIRSVGVGGRPHQLLATAPGSFVVTGTGHITAEAILPAVNVFGDSGDPGVVIFQDGAVFESQSGGNPFGLSQPASRVVWQSGSTYRHNGTHTPSISGRTYANFEYVSSETITFQFGGNNPWTVDDFRILNGTMNLTGSFNDLPINLVVRGDLEVAAGAVLNYSTSVSSTLLFNGGFEQIISGNGMFFLSENIPVDINKSPATAILQFDREVEFRNNLRILSGEVRGGGGSINMLTDNAVLEVSGGTINGTNLGPGLDLNLIVNAAPLRVTGNSTSACLFFSVVVNNGKILALQRGNFSVRFGGFNINSGATLRLDANGGLEAASDFPNYHETANLIYNSGGNYNRFREWTFTENPGFPGNVIVQNGTVLNLNSPPNDLGLANDLILGNAIGTGRINMGNTDRKIYVGGSFNLGGPVDSGTSTLSQGTQPGADVLIAGDYNQNNQGQLLQNQREIVMNGTGIQEMGNTLLFQNLAIDNNGGSVRPNVPLTVTNRLRLSNGTLDLSSFDIVLDDNALIQRTSPAAIMTEEPTTAGGRYDVEYTTSMTTDKEWVTNVDLVRDARAIGESTVITLQDNRTFNNNLDLINANLHLNGFTLTARGTTTSSTSWAGSINLSGGGTRQITGPGKFDITGLGGGIPTQRTKTFSAFDGSSLVFDEEVVVRIGDGRADFGVNNPVTIQGVLEVLAGGSIIFNSPFYAEGSVLRFANQIDYQVNMGDRTWSGVSINSGSAGIPWNVEILDEGSDLNLNRQRSLRNNLIITNGTFTLNSTGGDFRLGGNWTRMGSESAFNPNGQKVIFNGNSGQQIIDVPMSEAFDGLEIDNPEGLLLENDLRVNGNFTFEQGIVFPQSALVTFGPNAAALGASNQSHIDGYVRKEGTTDFNFPIGNQGIYQAAGIGTISGSSPAFTAAYFAETHPSLEGEFYYGTAQQPVSTCDYWEITPVGNSRATISLTYGNNSCNEVGEQPEAYELMDIAWYNNLGDWGPPEISGTDASNFGSVGTTTDLDLYGYFALSSLGSGFNVLPITLLHFDAYAVDGATVVCEWTTASEVNNDYFTIERSADGSAWEEVGRVQGAGNSNAALHYSFADDAPYTGVSYYRLRQTDFDGTTEVFAPRAVQIGQGGFGLHQVFRTESALDFVYTATAPYLTVEVFDLTGRLLHGAVIDHYDSKSRESLAVNLARGVYVLRLSDGTRSESMRFFY